MAHDYEDVLGVENLDDDELRQVIRETLRDNRSIDERDITVHVRDGQVTLEGRVGTEVEQRIAERVVSDRIGIEQVQNDLIVDPIRRAESPEAIDEHLADEAAHEGLLLGGRAAQEDDEARHLSLDENDEENGTVDLTQSMEEGIPWIPPESQTPEGETGTGTERDAGRDSY